MHHIETMSRIDGTASDRSDTDLLDLALVVVLNIRLLLAGPLLVGLVVFAISFTATPLFSATTSFIPVPVNFNGSAPKSATDQYVALLKSRGVLEALVARFDLVKHLAQKDTQHAADRLLERVTVKAAVSGLVTVIVEDADPYLAAAIANAYVQELGKALSRLSLRESQQRLQFVQKHLIIAQEKLSVAEREWGSNSSNTKLSKSSSALTVGRIARLDANIAAKEIELASMRSHLSESSFDYQQAVSDLSTMRSQKVQLEAAPVAAVADARGMATYRELKFQETLLDLLLGQYETARVDEMRDYISLKEVDAAVPPDRPSKPDKAKIAGVASITTFFALLLFVFIRHSLRCLAADEVSARKLYLLQHAFRKALGLKPVATSLFHGSGP
jgi:hypothetical protein